MSQIIVKDISFIQRDIYFIQRDREEEEEEEEERKLISPPGIKILTQALW